MENKPFLIERMSSILLFFIIKIQACYSRKITEVVGFVWFGLKNSFLTLSVSFSGWINISISFFTCHNFSAFSDEPVYRAADDTCSASTSCFYPSFLPLINAYFYHFLLYQAVQVWMVFHHYVLGYFFDNVLSIMACLDTPQPPMSCLYKYTTSCIPTQHMTSARRWADGGQHQLSVGLISYVYMVIAGALSHSYMATMFRVWGRTVFGTCVITIFSKECVLMIGPFQEIQNVLFLRSKFYLFKNGRWQEMG